MSVLARVTLSKEAKLYYDRNVGIKEASEIVIDYTKMWEHENKRLMSDFLITLINYRSNKMNVIDFYTIYDTNRIIVCIDLNQENARDFAKRFEYYYDQEQISEVVEVRKAKLFEVDVEDEDFDEVYIKVNQSI